MNGPIQPAWRTILEKLGTADYFFGASIDGSCSGPSKTRSCIARKHPHLVEEVREWWGWPDIDVPLPSRKG